MIAFFWVVFWTLLSTLLVAAGMSVHLRRKRLLGEGLPEVDDDALRTILETGALAVELDEPLDLRDIDEQEERFWSERWDEPEEV